MLGLPLYRPEPKGHPVTADQPVPHIPDAPPHGTLRGWAMGCHCMFCKSAKAATTVTVTDDSDAGTTHEGCTQ
jgi:hypothetical protein